MNRSSLKKLIIFLMVFFGFIFISYKDSFGMYRSVLNTEVYLSVLNPNTSYTITLNPGDGSLPPNTDSEIHRTLNQPIGTLPTPSLTNYNFIGWYTQDGQTKIENSRLITANETYVAHYVKIVCKKALVNTLHTETCHKESGVSTDPGCLNDAVHHYEDGYPIYYGNIPSGDAPESGDAYDCDVNDDDTYDPVTERFYFIRENTATDDTGVFVYYTGFDEAGQMDDDPSRTIHIYADVPNFLPNANYTDWTTDDVWDNPALVTFDGKVSRLATVTDLVAACGQFSTANGYLDSCNYYMENSRYHNNVNSRSAIWIEQYEGTYYRIDGRTRKIATVAANSITTSQSVVRPTIEVPYNTVEGYRERLEYRVTFDARGGRGGTYYDKYENQVLGTLPVPTKQGFRFKGWYTDYTNFTTEVTPATVVTATVTYYAKWEEIVDNMDYVFYLPGTCSFGGNTTNITSLPNDCESIINPTGQNISYTSPGRKYIDTGISLFSEENYE